MLRSNIFSAALAAATLAPLTAAWAAIPYSPVPAGGIPVIGPGVSPPVAVFGKEYSDDPDLSVLGPDPEQVLAWDGSGGTADTIDFTGTRPEWRPDQQVDALANSRDALFDDTLLDGAHLVFSHDDVVTAYGTGFGGPALVSVPSAGPIPLFNGNTIGGAGEVSIEEAGAFAPPSTQTIWAKTFEVNGMPEPVDVDGLELWGPEPRETNEPDAPVVGDADKYSLDVDLPSGVSVWNASGTPYIDWPTIATAVEDLLGPVPPTAHSLRDERQGRQAINLDALLVSDTIGSRDVFDLDDGVFEGEPPRDQNGEPFEPIELEQGRRGDTIVFSIRQIIDPDDPDGYYATGSELFVLDSLGPVDFLKHGGHAWDKAYAISELAIKELPDQPFEFAVIDINAIEAIGEEVITPPTPLPGDFNGDNVVDTADFTVWRDNYLTSHPLSGNGNETGTSIGVVDIDDYHLWRSNFGATAPSPLLTTSAAPEPSAAVLLAMAVAGLGFRRRK